MKVMHFWDGKQVITVPNSLLATDAKTFRGMYCVDTQHDDDRMRYGMFVAHGWDPFPLEEFPQEFRAWLLLLT